MPGADDYAVSLAYLDAVGVGRAGATEAVVHPAAPEGMGKRIPLLPSLIGYRRPARSPHPPGRGGLWGRLNEMTLP